MKFGVSLEKGKSKGEGVRSCNATILKRGQTPVFGILVDNGLCLCQRMAKTGGNYGEVRQSIPWSVVEIPAP